jgi:hypothetical protein
MLRPTASYIIDVDVVVLLIAIFVFFAIILSTSLSIFVFVLIFIAILVKLYRHVVGDFSKRLQLLCFVWEIFVDDITLVVSCFTQANQDEVASSHPHSVFEFSSDSGHTLLSIEALHFYATLSEHSQDLTVLLALFFIEKLSISQHLKVLSFLTLVSSLTSSSGHVFFLLIY